MSIGELYWTKRQDLRAWWLHLCLTCWTFNVLLTTVWRDIMHPPLYKGTWRKCVMQHFHCDHFLLRQTLTVSEASWPRQVPGGTVADTRHAAPETSADLHPGRGRRGAGSFAHPEHRRYAEGTLQTFTGKLACCRTLWTMAGAWCLPSGNKVFDVY